MFMETTAAGVEMRAQVALRRRCCSGCSARSTRSSITPHREIGGLTVDERVAILERPEFGAQAVAAAADAGPGAAPGGRLLQAFGRMFELITARPELDVSAALPARRARAGPRL
jgi:hypothetical protein